MATINRLQIQGIRSFSPNDRQAIEFSGPLTIILGKNGCGKTSIIESLLNATTGQMPPGSSAGSEKSSFIYDPKIMGDSEVKAQIRLNFKTSNGHEILAIRSFVSTSTARGVNKFETKDTAIAFRDETGKVTSQSYRAADADRMVPELFGVSRAVFEHVIFCHQEDCNWPLGPPGEVKTKFDDLFASTKYVAALDKLREQNKKQREDLKQAETALLRLKDAREYARKRKSELDSKKEQLDSMKANIENARPKLEVYQRALENVETAINSNAKLNGDRGKLQGRLTEVDRAIASCQQKIKARRGSGAESLSNNNSSNSENAVKKLQDNIIQLRNDITNKTAEARKKDERISNDLQPRRDATVNRRNEYNTRMQLLKSRQEEEESSFQDVYNRCVKMNSDSGAVVVPANLIEALKPESSMSESSPARGSSSNNNNNNHYQQRLVTLEKISQLVKGYLEELNKAANGASTSFDNLRSHHNTERSKLRRTVDTLRSEVVLNEKQVKNLKDKINNYNRELNSVSSSTSSSSSSVSKNTDPAAVRAEIATMKQKNQKLEQELSQKQQEVSGSSSNTSNTQSQLQTVQKELSQVRSQISSLSSASEAFSRVEMTKKHALDHLREKVLTPLLLQNTSNHEKLKTLDLSSSSSSSSSSSNLNGSDSLLLQEAKQLQSSTASNFSTFNESRRTQEAQLASVQNQIVDLTKRIAMHKKQLAEKEEPIKKAIASSTGDNNSNNNSNNATSPDLLEKQLIPSLEEQLRDVSTKLAHRKADAENFHRYIDVARADSKCVVCDRSFGDDDCSHFIKRKEKELADTPQFLKECTESQKQLESKLSTLRRVVPLAHQAIDLSSNVIPKAEAELSSLQSKLGELKSAVEGLKSKATSQQKELETANTILAEATRGADLFKQFRNEQLQAQKKFSSSSISTLQDVDSQLSQLRASEKEKEQLAKQLQNDAAQQDKVWKEQQHALESIRKSLMENEKKMHALEMSIAKREELTKNIAAAEKEIAEYQEAIKSLNEKGEHATKTLNQFEEEAKKKENAATGEKTLASKRASDFGSTAASIGATINKLLSNARNRNNNNNNNNGSSNNNNNETVDQLRAECEKREREIENIDTEITAAKKSIRVLREEIEKLRQQEEVYTEQVDLAQHYSTRQSIQESLEKVEQELNNVISKALSQLKETFEKKSKTDPARFNGNEIQQIVLAASKNDSDRVRALLNNQISQIGQQQAINMGSTNQLQSDVDSIIEELSDPRSQYSGIANRYTAAFIKKTTIELVVADIDKFYKVLERAVSTYHQEKIAQINKIIAHLWRATYRGTDIDTIEIKSDDATTTGAGTGIAGSTATRRQYKYRVVMKKGGSELDMRGRCSAGQKVLASVVIRLALSEAFCSDCGILALDEPTTNLDSENAKSLAAGLRNLIEERRQNRKQNFQLVVITHDEDFVRALGAKGTDQIYYVQKDGNGAYSLITPKTYGELFS